MAQHVIELTVWQSGYGDFTAVDNLDLNIRKGEIFGLLDPMVPENRLPSWWFWLDGAYRRQCFGLRNQFTTSPVEVKEKVGYLPEDVGILWRYDGNGEPHYYGRTEWDSPICGLWKTTSLLHRWGWVTKRINGPENIQKGWGKGRIGWCPDQRSGNYHSGWTHFRYWSYWCAGLYPSDPPSKSWERTDCTLFFASFCIRCSNYVTVSGCSEKDGCWPDRYKWVA